MTLETFISILVSAVAAGTPLVYASLGELITEKAGVLNLGVEGMMLTGTITGFMAMSKTVSIVIALIAE